MRNIIMSLAISFDGKIEGPNGEIDWILFDKAAGAALTEFLANIDTVLFGRISYDMWGKYSPPEDSADFEKHFYNELNAREKIVFSRSQSSFPGDPKVISANVPEFIRDLKTKPGKDIWLYGGAGLITSLLNEDLVDRLWVAVMPVILGQGKSLFNDILQRHPMKLIKAEPSHQGVLDLHYEFIRKS